MNVARHGPPPTSLESRFWKYVNKTEGCWLWVGAKNSKGYGVTHVGQGVSRRSVYAHRAVYDVLGLPVSGPCVLHRCDTPLCVNPAHHFFGTKADNVADMQSKNRARAPGPHAPRVGAQNPLARLTEMQAADVRLRERRGESRASIARLHGVDWSCVDNIIKARTWFHLSQEAA